MNARTRITPCGAAACSSHRLSAVTWHETRYARALALGRERVSGPARGTAGPQALWGVTNASDALARAVGLGAAPLDPVQDVGDGIRVCAVRDPFGNRIGFIENPKFDVAKIRQTPATETVPEKVS